MLKTLFPGAHIMRAFIEDAKNVLRWAPDLGIGYLPSDGYDYDAAYWEKYLKMEDTQLGRDLMQARLSFVIANLEQSVSEFFGIDIGIGSGAFVKLADFYGYDVNPHAVEWLKSVGSYLDVYDDLPKERPLVLTMWDVLEHIDDPTPLLSKAEHVFTSLPIHADLSACIRSKHLRPNEHIWHFTEDGITAFMNQQGFALNARTDFESRLGREDIISYHFKRQAA